MIGLPLEREREVWPIWQGSKRAGTGQEPSRVEVVFGVCMRETGKLVC